MKLSENFSLKEMTQSQTALKNNIDNSPNVTQIDNLQQLCQNILQPLRDDFQLPIKITSGFRSRELAEMIGSNPDNLNTQKVSKEETLKYLVWIIKKYLNIS